MQARRQQRGIQACRIDQATRLQLRAIGGAQPHAARRGSGLLHLGMADHHAACVFELALQSQHQAVAVDDAG